MLVHGLAIGFGLCLSTGMKSLVLALDLALALALRLEPAQPAST